MNSKTNWRWFLLKALLLLSLLLPSLCYLGNRYRLGIDPQKSRCLPQRFFLIDRQNTSLHLGKFYAFRTKNCAPFFQNGTLLVKRLVAGPGDRIAISATKAEIRINDQLIAIGLPLADKLNRPLAHFAGQRQLPSGEYWFLGECDHSFDSRYWGAVTEQQIIGRAYALF
ncbi:MAG: signal peptidase I (plasmid) [Candidatus Symbiodolus clandestinus]